jgi:hypothetical protein
MSGLNIFYIVGSFAVFYAWHEFITSHTYSNVLKSHYVDTILLKIAYQDCILAIFLRVSSALVQAPVIHFAKLLEKQLKLLWAKLLDTSCPEAHVNEETAMASNSKSDFKRSTRTCRNNVR